MAQEHGLSQIIIQRLWITLLEPGTVTRPSKMVVGGQRQNVRNVQVLLLHNVVGLNWLLLPIETSKMFLLFEYHHKYFDLDSIVLFNVRAVLCYGPG